MKNKDIQYVQKIIEYCDIADNLLDEYERDYLLFQNHHSLFSYLQACALFKLENMFQDYLMSLKKNIIISRGSKSKE